MSYQIENIYAKRFFYFNLYVIKGSDGDILIDTGFLCMKRKIKRWLDKFNIKLIILTHAHVDHTWNTNYIKKLYNCEVAFSKRDLENIDNTKIKTEPLDKKYNAWTNFMKFGMKHCKPRMYDIDYYLEEDEMINKYGLDLKVISLEGHTTGSIGILYKDYLFAGDALVNRKNKPSIAYQNQNTSKAYETYNKIKEIKPKVIFVGHDKKIECSNL